jgi:hypothetical protein
VPTTRAYITLGSLEKCKQREMAEGTEIVLKKLLEFNFVLKEEYCFTGDRNPYLAV